MLKNKKSILALLAIVAAASLFRLTNLDLIEFKADEAINLFLAAQPSLGKPLPPGGTASSIGILNPPLFTYILYPLTRLTLNPEHITFFIALVNTLSVGLFFLILKRYYGQTTAIITSLFLAFSPWMILFARKIWTQDLIFPFFVLFFYGIHKIFIDKQEKHWITVSFFATLILQLHQVTIIFFLLITPFLIKKINFKYVFIGTLLGIIPFLPYAWYQINNGCPDCFALATTSSRFPSERSLTIFLRPLQILGQGNFNHVLGNDMLTFANMYPMLYKLRSLFYIEYLLLPLGIFLFIKKYKVMRFLAIATLLLPIVYYLLRIEPYAHYFLIVAPLLFLFLGVVFSHLFSLKNPFVKTGVISIFFLLISLSIYFNVAFFSLLRDKGGVSGDYGPTFTQSKNQIEQKLVKYKDDPNYSMLFIANFIPKRFMHGDFPIPKMIYDSDNIKRNLENLEKQFETTPDNPLLENQLLAFYTHDPLNRQTINNLKQKVKKNSIYATIYNEALEGYQTKKLKKIYSDNFISLEHPQHWSALKIPDGLLTKDDNFYVVISRNDQAKNTYFSTQQDRTYSSSSARVLNQDITKTTCTRNNKWCGVLYDGVRVGSEKYTIIFQLLNINKAIPLEETKFPLSVMEEIVSSIEKE